MSAPTSAHAVERIMQFGESASLLVKVSPADLLMEPGGAMFSFCERYRYLLWRVWDTTLPMWTFGMLNPSTADDLILDPTIRRCVEFAKAGGAGGLIVWNLFAWRATDPAAMKMRPDPIGPLNNLAIVNAVRDAALTVAAWGMHGSFLNRESEVRGFLNMLKVPLHAMTFTKDGHPRHPLYLPARLKPEPWEYCP